MLRKLTLAALISTGIMGGLTALPSTASADVPRSHNQRGKYEVLVRHRNHWHVHGVYRDREDAKREVRKLERRGLDARIERAIYQ